MSRLKWIFKYNLNIGGEKYVFPPDRTDNRTKRTFPKKKKTCQGCYVALPLALSVIQPRWYGSFFCSFSVQPWRRLANFVSWNIGLKYISPLPFCQPWISFVLIPNSSDIWPGISISTLEIGQERSRRFSLRVEWTSAFKGFYKMLTYSDGSDYRQTASYRPEPYRFQCLYQSTSSSRDKWLLTREQIESWFYFAFV